MLTPARPARFLRVLGETGNVTEAARVAGVGRMIPYNLRRADQWFARAWDAALAGAPGKVAMRQPSPLGWVRRAANGRVQIAEMRANMWTERDDKAFLAELAQTGNVNAAARAIGRNPDSAWRRRRSSPAFERAFEEAIGDARVRLEYGLVAYSNQLIDRAGASLEGSGQGPDRDGIVTATDASFALQIAKWLDSRAGGARRGNLPAEPPIEEVRAEVLRRIEAMERHSARHGKGEDEGAGAAASPNGGPAAPFIRSSVTDQSMAVILNEDLPNKFRS